MSTFPQPWLDLLIADSDLGAMAPQRLQEIEAGVAREQDEDVFPPRAARYRALECVPPDQISVVIVGQDPYHGLAKLPDGREVPQAMGLSFSVPHGVRLPPSLRNIFKELAADLGGTVRADGDLSDWASQGVLLLNTVLSVRRGQPKSHDMLGWQGITSQILRALSRRYAGLVFICWGNSARALIEHISANDHTVIESSHPSPIGGSCNKGFFGSRPFSRANAALAARGRRPINWKLSE